MSESRGAARAEILSIGDELLLGEIVDTNGPYMAQRLVPLGLSVGHYQTSGDDMDAIVAAFKLALSRADVVIATGGLGPTDDDLTMEAVAKVFGVPLEHREEVLDQMAARLKRPKDHLTGSNRKQAMLPAGAHVLRNDWGTAPGVRYSTPEGKHVFLMAGVPREMKGIFGAWVVPFLREHYTRGETILLRHFAAFGIPESRIGERLKDMMGPGHNPDVGTRVSGGACVVRIVVRAKSQPEAEALMQPAAARVAAALEEGLFSDRDETLAIAVARMLIEKKKTVAVAESCTAGLIASLLAETPGISASLLEGAVVYSNDAKVRTCGVRPETLDAHGAVSEEAARELAQGIRARANADVGLSVTGIAGPDGGSEQKPVGLFYVGLATKDTTAAHKFVFHGLDRNIFRERAAHQALDLLRRQIGA
ncbi:MAG: competence/damage-inducible protein A [Planctomycetota bacterium]|nr:competence/damage-inducible protein A [Planctomycetota bacterium]